MNQRKPCGFTGDGDIGQELNPHYRLQQKRNHSTGLIKTEKGFSSNSEALFSSYRKDLVTLTHESIFPIR